MLAAKLTRTVILNSIESEIPPQVTHLLLLNAASDLPSRSVSFSSCCLGSYLWDFRTL